MPPENFMNTPDNIIALQVFRLLDEGFGQVVYACDLSRATELLKGKPGNSKW